MTIAMVPGRCDELPPRRARTAGLESFPTTGCAGVPGGCTDCLACADDCADCEMCMRFGCATCEPTDLTPRTAKMLVDAARALAHQVRAEQRRCARPASLHFVANIFEDLARTLEAGNRPWPRIIAEQLCTFLMIGNARELACSVGERFASHLPLSDFDYDFDRLYDTLLPDDAHLAFVEAAGFSTNAETLFYVTKLAQMLPPGYPMAFV